MYGREKNNSYKVLPIITAWLKYTFELLKLTTGSSNDETVIDIDE